MHDENSERQWRVTHMPSWILAMRDVTIVGS
jgi:hypothetical protein